MNLSKQYQQRVSYRFHNESVAANESVDSSGVEFKLPMLEARVRVPFDAHRLRYNMSKKFAKKKKSFFLGYFSNNQALSSQYRNT